MVMRRVLIAACLALAGCADPHEPLAYDFGHSVRANIAAQVVNPTPNMTAEIAATDGKRIENAMTRYRTNTVYPPRPESGTALIDNGHALPSSGAATTPGY
jgi:type IV pilus biogenesis protein CpaD/CtpE